MPGKKRRMKQPMHANAKDIRLLQQGFVPSQSKLGKPFRGKNRIIVA